MPSSILPFTIVHRRGGARAAPPILTQPVNDFAGVIDQSDTDEMDRRIRALQAASSDVVVVATVRTFQPDYGDINQYAVKMFENGGRGIGEKGKDNGLLIVVAVDDRKVKIEVGYDLEQFVTDGFAGETIRTVMTPEFRNGNYGAGLLAGDDPDHQPHRGRTRRHAAGRPAVTAPGSAGWTVALPAHPDHDRGLHSSSAAAAAGGAAAATTGAADRGAAGRVASGRSAEAGSAAGFGGGGLVADSGAEAADSADLAAAAAAAAAPPGGGSVRPRFGQELPSG